MHHAVDIHLARTQMSPNRFYLTCLLHYQATQTRVNGPKTSETFGLNHAKHASQCQVLLSKGPALNFYASNDQARLCHHYVHTPETLHKRQKVMRNLGRMTVLFSSTTSD
jgi:hypothetical protein